MARLSFCITLLLLGTTLGLVASTETEVTELPTKCRITVRGPNAEDLQEGGPVGLVHYAAFRCTGENLPVRMQVHPAILKALKEADGVELEPMESEKGFVLLSDVTGVLLENCLFADLVGSTLAPLVLVGSRVGISGCEFSRNSQARSGGLHATDSVTVVSKTVFTSNAGLSFGAIGALEGTRVAIRNCTFWDNTGGTETEPLGGFVAGALFAFKNALIDIKNANFTGNVAIGAGGGAITTVNKCISTILDTLFMGNSGDSGAIAALQFSQVTVTGSEFRSNKGTNLSGVITARIRSKLTVNGTQFSLNSAGTGCMLAMGGSDISMHDAVMANNEGVTWGGVVSVVEGGALTIIESLFVENLGAIGGAIFGDSMQSLIIEGSEFRENLGGKAGGAIYQSNCRDTKIASCVFSGNSALLNGGAVAQMGCSHPNSTTFSLAGCDDVEPQSCGDVSIMDSTFENNSAAKQGRDVCQGSCEMLILKSSTFSAKTESDVESVYQEHCGHRFMEGNTFTKGSAVVKESEFVLVARDCPLEGE